MTENAVGRGTVLAGRFRLEDLVTETEGARFWRATDQILARSVAVNVISDHDPRAEALLVAARTSATVTDGHFLRVLDAAEEDGVVYVVHEWGTGMSLDKMLADGPLPARRAAWLVKEVAEAITTAHRQGIAHGRLIPENVMVTEAGSVKLIGFVVDAVLHGRQPTAEGESVPLSDHESDVRNLGALLYVTLVGKWPGLPGTRLPEAPRDHGRALRPRQVRAGVPRPLDTICDRVLNAGQNSHQLPLETAHEVCAALSDFIGDPATAAQVGYEPTSVIPAAGLEGLRSGVRTGDPEATQVSPPPHRDEDDDRTAATGGAASAAGAAAAAGAGAAAAASTPPADPDATQAGAPLFYDDDSGIGWVSDTPGRGLRSDESAQRTPPPPPPPFPEPEAKPLFAPGPPRAAAASGAAAGAPGSASDTGSASAPGGFGRSSHGTGSLPPVWGPDAPVEPPSTDSRSENAGRGWMRLAVIVATCLVLVLAVVIAFNLGRGSGDEDTTPAGEEPSGSAGNEQPARPLAIAGVRDFDPEGDPAEENTELAPLAVDGDPGTAWKTMTYYGNPQLGLLKDGVGLVVDLGSAKEVSSVQVDLVGQPTDVELFATPEGQGSPSTVDGLQQVGRSNGAGQRATMKLDEPVTTQYLVVWLTSLPATSDGFQGQIAEIVVRP